MKPLSILGLFALIKNLRLLSAALYSAIYQLALRRDDVVELTVEDPSEAFEDLRDRNDLKMLQSLEVRRRSDTRLLLPLSP